MSAATPREARVWARENGYDVGVRGPLSADVKDAFTKATGRAILGKA